MLEIIGQLKLKKPFTASNGWLWRFQRRWRISSSCRTDKVRQSDAVRAVLMDRFLDCYLDVQNHLFDASVDDTAYGHFRPNQHWNTDQIPVPFAMPCKRTLNSIGDRAPTRQDVPSGLSKRQATIHLTLRADGEQIVPPVLIVRGTGIRITEEEKNHYRSLKHVVVYFQKKAWADGDFILWYFEEVFVPALKKHGLMDDQIVFLDNLGSHKVDYVKEYMMSNGLYPMYLPPNMTDVCQPVDRHIGGNLKTKMKRLYTEHKKTHSALWSAYSGRNSCNDSLDANKRRMLIATWLDDSWIEMRETTNFRNAFESTGCLMERNGTNKINLVGFQAYSYVRDERLRALHSASEVIHDFSNLAPECDAC